MLPDGYGKDISKASQNLGQFDIVFSNAALQWVAALDGAILRLFTMFALAIQVPYAEKLIASPKWSRYFGSFTNQPEYHPNHSFYKIIRILTSKFHIWQTDYIQVMGDPSDIVDWTKGASLRPFVNALPTIR